MYGSVRARDAMSLMRFLTLAQFDFLLAAMARVRWKVAQTFRGTPGDAGVTRDFAAPKPHPHTRLELSAAGGGRLLQWTGRKVGGLFRNHCGVTD
ncbi:hypothetical protein CEP54_011177 [Fusarium duplospermum]|uniref:Uncharacterized protein n=1 Tax=Fusarium duplospermum TaxID=1325734 RepID=A0A428PFW4_9HYPO|nr:hypothetical protein CEP54_011177 [Fusarium duplospermum]